MKKTKILVATLTAAAITVSCGALAACNKGGEDGGKETPPATTTYEITFDANGGSWANNVTTQKLTTGTDGKLTALPDPEPTRTDYTFANYNTKQDGTGSTITVSTTYNIKTTVYAQWTENEPDPGPSTSSEYTITLHVGIGTLPTGTSTTLTTNDGKIDGSTLPEPTVTTAHWEFDDWYTAEEGGEAVGTGEITLDDDAHYYARYKRDTGVWKGDTFVRGLTLNGGAAKEQYWLGLGNEITLSKNDEVSIYLDGKLMTYTVFQSSSCIEVPASSARVTSVKVSENATFILYLTKHAENDWQVEYTGTPAAFDIVSVVDPDCVEINVKWGATDDKKIIKFYLIDPDGNAMGASDLTGYYLYAYNNGNEIFGNWQNLYLTGDGALAENMEGLESVTISNLTFIFRWGAINAADGNGGSQTSNLTGMKPGHSYVISLSTGTTTIQEYVPAAE